MNIYDTLKTTLTVPQVARHYGLVVNRNDMTCCPFHCDRHPSMKLNEDYYYCFGCETSGDVIDLVAGLFNLSPADAARKLAADFHVLPTPPNGPAVRRKEVLYVKTHAYREEEHRCFMALRSYLYLLMGWKEVYSPLDPAEPVDDRYVEACKMVDVVEALLDYLLFGSDELRLATVREFQSDSTLTHLEEYVERRRKEDYEQPQVV